MSDFKTVTLANGVVMPTVAQGCAFGNWANPNEVCGFLPEQAWRATTLALKVGLRSFDMAHVYGTERHVGDVLGRHFADGCLTRDQVFLTTKIFHPTQGFLSHRHTWNPRDVPDVCQRVLDDYNKSLHNVGVGQFDLLLVHWPGAFLEKDADYAREARAKIWSAMERIYKLGTARAIGVCNFTKTHLEQLFETCTVKPMVNQIELHPYCQDTELVKFCHSNNIVVEAYAPYASGAFGLLKDPVIAGIAERIGCSIGQVILRWHLQKGHVVLPKSSNEGRMAQNLELFHFSLSDEDMAAIDALQGPDVPPRRTCNDPNTIL